MLMYKKCLTAEQLQKLSNLCNAVEEVMNDTDIIHNWSDRYRHIDNPALQFANDVKDGKYNGISDEQFEYLSKRVDMLSFDIFADTPYYKIGTPVTELYKLLPQVLAEVSIVSKHNEILDTLNMFRAECDEAIAKATARVTEDVPAEDAEEDTQLEFDED